MGFLVLFGELVITVTWCNDIRLFASASLLIANLGLRDLDIDLILNLTIDVIFRQQRSIHLPTIPTLLHHVLVAHLLAVWLLCSFLAARTR